MKCQTDIAVRALQCMITAKAHPRCMIASSIEKQKSLFTNLEPLLDGIEKFFGKESEAASLGVFCTHIDEMHMGKGSMISPYFEKIECVFALSCIVIAF